MSNNTVKAQSNFVSSDAIDVKNVTYITAKGNPARNPIFIHLSRAKVGVFKFDAAYFVALASI